MKKYFLILLVSLAAVCCTEEKIKTYQGGHYLSFLINGQTDSTLTSFFFFPQATSIDIPIAVTLGGGPLAADLSYELEVVADKSNALQKNYELTPGIFRKGMVQDTIHVIIHKSDELAAKEYTLVVSIKPNSTVESGQTEYRTSKIVFSSKATKPEWWDTTVEKAYLGTYSDTKYEHFLIATEGRSAYFNLKDADGKRALALEFLYYLRKAKDSGNPIMDGKSEMKITVVG